jgi:hypothetical protein
LEEPGKGNGQSKNRASGSILKPDIFALVKTGHFNFGLTPLRQQLLNEDHCIIVLHEIDRFDCFSCHPERLSVFMNRLPSH